MNSTILDNFNSLKDTNDSTRLNAAVILLNHLYHHNTNQNENDEINYALTRLVRSLGSSTVFGRRGFYSTLTVFLTMYRETSMEKLLSIMDAQLRPAGSNSKSENADICMGRILLCGALIRSKLLVQGTIEVQQQVIEILLSAGKQRSYLSFISVVFLCEFISQLDIQPMKKAVWPIVEKELRKSWSEQTLDSFYVLLVVRDRYPTLVNHKFLKQHLNVEDIVDKESIKDIVRLLTDVPRYISYHHPVFELFCKKLTSTDLTVDFWRNIDGRFVKPSKSDEYIAIEVLRLILPNITDKTVIPSLLSPNFLRHILKRFSNCKKNNDDALIAFRKILHTVASITSDKDIDTKTQLSILKKLILHPTGDLMIEKKTGTKIIQIITGNMRLDGIKMLCELYKDIIENKTTDERDGTVARIWTNAERSYAAQLLTRLMGHSETFSDQDWRLTQLIFLFNYGLCEVTNVGIELAPQFKDSFYRALDYKLPKLNDVRRLLSALVHDLNSKLQSKAIQLRTPLSDAAFDAWKRMINLLGKLEESTKITEALPIFHTMNLHMGLQLFSDSEMAIMSINELQCCYERLIKKPKRHTKIDVSTKEEPNWVEVVVDLLLSLLSRNNHLLRSLVSCVFPHICPYLTSSAVQQILAILDVKNNIQDILTTKESDDELSSSAENASDDDTEGNASDDEISEETESESDDANIDGDETLTDRLRVAVRQALGEAASQTDNEDIDVDQIDDDEAKRLDESLATAFKILREGRRARSKKQTKTNQTMMHFRVRVIDLLDIYLETCPSMAITLNVIAPLFALLEFCIKDPYQKPLECRVRACLKKLSAVKRFKDTTTDVDDNLFTTVLKNLIEKGERSASVCQEISDKLADCCTFLVRCMQQANLSTESVGEIYVENLIAFFEKRDCILPFILFKGVLQLRWEDNWQLASVLVRFAFDSNIRYFRRNQALELLLVLYNNNRLLSVDTKRIDLRIRSETMLYDKIICMFKESYNLHVNKEQLVNGSNMQKKVQQKFIGLLFTLLRVIYTHHLPEAWNWQNIKVTLTEYRSGSIFSKEARNAYNKLATQIGIPLSANNKQSSIGTSEKQAVLEKSLERETDDSEDETPHGNNIQKKKTKNKSKLKSKQILKKEARELRSEIISKGLEPFNFSNVHLPENQTDLMESLQNGNSHESTSSRPSRKRSSKIMEENNVSKRKKDANCV